MPVSVPIGGVPVNLHISLLKRATRCGEGGSQEIRPGPMIPKSRMVQEDCFAVQCGEWIPHQGFKPDSLQDRFGKDRKGFLPKDVFTNPLPIGDSHKDETGILEKGFGGKWKKSGRCRDYPCLSGQGDRLF